MRDRLRPWRRSRRTPRARARCRTGWLYTRMCGSRRSRPHGQPHQNRPDALAESQARALQPLDTDIEAAAAARELPAEARRVSDLGWRLAHAERQLPAARAQAERRSRRSDFRAE